LPPARKKKKKSSTSTKVCRSNRPTPASTSKIFRQGRSVFAIGPDAFRNASRADPLSPSSPISPSTAQAECLSC
jgi:hypothetical protein